MCFDDHLLSLEDFFYFAFEQLWIKLQGLHFIAGEERILSKAWNEPDTAFLHPCDKTTKQLTIA